MEVRQATHDEMWFKVAGKHLKVSVEEFALASGLTCQGDDNINKRKGKLECLSLNISYCVFIQRIALVYFVVAIIETLTTKLRPTVLNPGYLSIFTAYKWQWFGGFVAFVIYMVTAFALYVPDWSFVVHHKLGAEKYTVKCGMRGHFGPACNAVGYVDRQVWGINHLYSQPVWSRLKVRVQKDHITDSYTTIQNKFVLL
ncbi:uncharacterized protein LOC111395278 [Olea europaea var. sylvestris]|uniref:uncharacterized protein LOC111395278 n=1 Tax=Olea europaea var. sylvestris TaxID=158386 RepID=UPI000C1D0FA0|nr:uncharacterized protein LOC111395278 [Olea europaea var. sylvestris]